MYSHIMNGIHHQWKRKQKNHEKENISAIGLVINFNTEKKNKRRCHHNKGEIKES